MILPFTLQQLRIIKAISTETSFTKAAEILFISQPSLSKQVKTLERRLGIQLITKNKNKIVLSEAGQLLLQYSERILALCEESCRALTDFKNGERRTLNIGATQIVGTYLIPRVLALFNENYPQINLKVQINSSTIITKNVFDNSLDIGLIEGYIPDFFKKKLQIENFIENEFHLIVSKSHPIAVNNRKTINKVDLYHLNFIAFNANSTTRKFIDNILIQNDIEVKEFNIIMELNSIEAIKTAVSLGIGVSFVSSFAIEKEIELKTLKIINIENIKISHTLSIITNNIYYHSKALDYFYNELWSLKNIIKKLKSNSL
jgi:DNA-binding transcriptional LysR family regulator